MSTLTSFKLVASKKARSLSPVVQRRNKLANKLHEQIELCEAQRAGAIYHPSDYAPSPTNTQVSVLLWKPSSG